MRVPSDVPAQSPGRPDMGAHSLVQPGPAPHASGNGAHQATSDTAAMEIAARTALVLTALLGEIRESLGRLAQIEQGVIANGQGDAIASLLAKVKRGDRLASELLAYSGRQQLAPKAVEMLPLLCSLAHLLRGTLDRSIHLTVEVDDNCPPCHVDAQALEDALVHLAINARDAMPHGGRLHLAARLARPAHGVPAVALTVFDSGVGMFTDTAHYAEVPFFTTRANDPLAGLGLAAVEGFVRQSGGSMQLRTSVGTGTSVTFHLPLAG